MFFTHSQKPKFGPSFANLFRSFSLALFFPLPFFALWSKYPKQWISKTRHPWKDLSLKKLLFINLYLASRGLSIFLDKLGRLKRNVARRDKTGTILEPQTNRVSKHENRVSSFEKPAFFILTT